MRSCLAVILFFSFDGFLNSVIAQQQIFKNYTVNDGLISNTICKVFQDSKGFIWIGTLEGLSKYDGYAFTNYSTANGLSHSMVNDFYESKEGNLYVALNNGNIDMLSDDKIFSKIVPSTVTVNCFMHTPWQQVITTTDGNGFQNFTNGKLVKPAQGLPLSTFYDITILNDTSFVATSENFIYVFDKNYRLLSKIKAAANKFSAINVCLDSEKRIWIASNLGLKLVKDFPSKNKIISYAALPNAFNIAPLRQGNINGIFEDEEGTMWFATSAGIVKINTDGSQQILTVKDGLSSNIVTSIFQDKEKNIWFGTAVGLSKLVAKSLVRLYPLWNGVSSNDNSYLLYPCMKNNFLVGTSAGVELFNKLSGNFSPTSLSKDEKIIGVIPNTYPPLFIGLSAMQTFDTAELKFHKTNLVQNYQAGNIISDNKGNFFVSDLSRLFFYSAKTKYKILDDRITSMLIDKAGYLWAGTWQNGLLRMRYSFDGSRFRLLSTNHFLPGGNIRSLFEDTKGNVWAGTRYEGVYRLSNNENDNFSILSLSQKNGLTSNFVKGIREDRKGNFWLAFYHGLDKLIPNKGGFRIFNFSRVNNYFASIVGIEIGDGNQLWLATGEGIVKIKDGELEKTPPLPVYITKVSSPDSMYSFQAKSTILNYRQNEIQFEFSAPGYINEKQVLYSYRLQGDAVKQWSKAANMHFVSYAGLQSGKYKFQVRTLGWNGAWGPAAVFEFRIAPPFWKTWWFILLLSLCALLLVYLFIKWRIKNIREIEAEKLKVQQLQSDHYKSELEMEQVINYFSSSLIDKNNINDVLWDVAKNLIGRLGFEDCMIYLWNEDKTRMLQRAGFGPKGSVEEISKQPFDVVPGQGVVGYVIQTKEPVLIPDTSKDDRYRADEATRLSEIAVPVIYNNDLIGVIDSEHHFKNFFTRGHLQVLNTIATLVANKIKSLEAEQSLIKTKIEIYSINEQLSKARLEALRSQMNPHFIFNCINSIDALIQSNDKYNATVYLNKFAKLIRGILDSSKQNTVSLTTDMQTLKLYIEMEQFRHEDKFTAEIQADDELLQDDYKVPPLIIQPFVENAILHGLRYRHDTQGKLFISVHKQNGHLKYVIEDNGIGRYNNETQLQKNKISYGIAMSMERVKLFNNDEQASVHITDLFANGKPAGTKVSVLLKIE